MESERRESFSENYIIGQIGRYDRERILEMRNVREIIQSEEMGYRRLERYHRKHERKGNVRKLIPNTEGH